MSTAIVLDAFASPPKVAVGPASTPLPAAEFHKALRECNQLEMRLSRVRELQLSSYMLIFDKAAWRWLYSLARGRFQRQLCMGQRSWSAWEYTGRKFRVRGKKSGKERQLSEQAMKIDSIETLLRRAGYMDPDKPVVPASAPVHHITSDVHASSKKRIVSTLLVGITAREWKEAESLPWIIVARAKDAVRRDPTEAGLALMRALLKAARHAALLDRKCWLAPPLEWVVEVESKRYVRRPRPKPRKSEKKVVVHAEMVLDAEDDPFADDGDPDPGKFPP
jgi:hypothetical protein